MGSVSYRQMGEEDRTKIIDIFNYYIENSYAAFLEQPVGYEFFDLMLNLSKGYPAITAVSEEGEVLGFAFLRTYNPMPAFRQSAEISYFIRPESVRQGIGQGMLAALTQQARKMGINQLLACISSLNQNSIDFHLSQGFVSCGRFRAIGNKRGIPFDMIWVQKSLAEK